MTYYIWHDDGCCDNSTDDLIEARSIRKELHEEGHSAYVTDEDGMFVQFCDYCDERAVRLMPGSSDKGVTIEFIPCCQNHVSGWWDGADWDGRALEVPLIDDNEQS